MSSMDLFTMEPLPNAPHVSEQLANALRTGDLPAALRLVNGRSHTEATEIMLKAGFSVMGYGKTTDSRRCFWHHFERQLTEAARHRVDGYGLRERAGQ